MNPHAKGCFRLFQVRGITVFVHWSWFLVAVFEVSSQEQRYPSMAWNVVEYLGVFGIVLLHEFGHALACRQVGGTADRIVLWPLGGIAFVNPPPRPGALLWSIVAGPLVNVLLVPVSLGLLWLAHQVLPEAAKLCFYLALINFVMLVFNLLPVYPLDGGQICHALLWFLLGRWRSLLVVSVIGLLGAAALIVVAFSAGSPWLVILAAFVGLRAVAGIRQARTLLQFQPGLDLLERAAAAIKTGAFTEAIAACDQALEFFPTDHPLSVGAHAGRGLAYLQLGALDKSLDAFDETVRLQPRNPLHYVNRGLALVRAGKYDRAVADYNQALALSPHLASALNNLAWLHATCPDVTYRDGARAVELATRACQLSGGREASHIGTLGAACAESGNYEAALAWQEKALADPRYAEIQGEKARERIRLYQERRPYREEAQAPAPFNVQ